MVNHLENISIEELETLYKFGSLENLTDKELESINDDTWCIMQQKILSEAWVVKKNKTDEMIRFNNFLNFLSQNIKK